MNLLLLSNGDSCRSRIAEALLRSFGRGFRITTAGIAEDEAVSDAVYAVLEERGADFSRVKPVVLSSLEDQSWDYVITLSSEAEEVRKNRLNGIPATCCPFEEIDPEDREQVRALYEQMDRVLYNLYRDVLSEQLLPRCRCGANTFCRCE